MKRIIALFGALLVFSSIHASENSDNLSCSEALKLVEGREDLVKVIERQDYCLNESDESQDLSQYDLDTAPLLKHDEGGGGHN